MRSTQITTHEEDGLNRLLYQYKGKTKLEDLIKDISTTQIQELENSSFQLFSRLSIDISEGVQLDNIGTIVGQPRNALDDVTYRLFLRAKIGQNTSEGEIEKVLDIWRLISGADNIRLMEVYPAEIWLYYDTVLAEELVDMAFELMQNVVGAGIIVRFLISYDTDNAFAFAGGDSIKISGFGDANDPLIGGKLSTIQNLSGLILSFSPTNAFAFAGGDSVGVNGFGDAGVPATGGELATLLEL
ncbi:DUF2612 domain-containing protein [Candidatus Pacearchaeota archaeon]|nr:DUF2612 domain-containing protein [Candidatus Pacearchaeota archaeon]